MRSRNSGNRMAGTATESGNGHPAIMGKHANSKADTIFGAILLVLIAAAAVAAIPLMIVTRSGQP